VTLRRREVARKAPNTLSPKHQPGVKARNSEDPWDKAHRTAKWAVTMTKWWIRHAVKRAPFPRWHFLTFAGPGGRESRGVVDLIVVRKDHSTPRKGLKRGDALQIILIQVKGGSAPKPTAEDTKRLRIVARQHGACEVLLAAWKKGKAPCFYFLRKKTGALTWIPIDDLSVFLHRLPSHRQTRLTGNARVSPPAH
jgi:hypothetical protein